MFGLFKKKKATDSDEIVANIAACKLQKIVNESSPLERAVAASSWWKDREAGIYKPQCIYHPPLHPSRFNRYKNNPVLPFIVHRFKNSHNRGSSSRMTVLLGASLRNCKENCNNN
jgi:hypothetical protein